MKHIDAHLQALAEGTLSSRRYRAMLEHAKQCGPCGDRFEASIRLLRVMENQSAFVPARIEREAIAALGPPLPKRARAVWAWGALAAASLGLTLVVVSSDEWQARGDGAGKPASLRLFCGGQGKSLHEVDGAGCAAGESLAFAAGAAVDGATIQLKVTGAAAAEATLQVKGKPGAEQALDLTVPLREAGAVHVQANIGETVLRQSFEVRP